MTSESSTNTERNTYLYDPLDRLLASATLQRFYQHAFLVTGLQGNQARSFLRHQSQPLAQRGESNSLLATDQQHSVLTATPGNPRISYGPYGQRATRDDDLLGFNGELPDEISGHYPLGNGHRWFNPLLMRFNSPDRFSPLDKGGINAYCYCLGDPINRRDPSGRSPIKHMIESALALTGRLSDNLPSPTWLQNTNKQFFADALEIAQTSAMRKTGAPLPGPLADSKLSKFGHGPGDNPAPFSEKLAAVVRNKVSHGKPPLPDELTETYMRTSISVNAGEISSVTAHLSMIEPWQNQGGPAGFVAVTLHRISAAVSGVEDHARLKTGKDLRAIRRD